jgi:hypothetical protein
MARTGGTVICRCLASMKDVVLLSEIHPLGMQTFNPLQQAHTWYKLLNEADLDAARSGRLGFPAAIELIHRRCSEQGKTLVLRDWSHLDYIGVPFNRPGYRSLLAEQLGPAFTLVRYSTVRHPLDQWLSVAQQPVFRQSLGPVRFLRGASRFAESAVQTGFMRFEDFARDNDKALRQLCDGLDLEFDPGYREKWQAYNRITGDVLPGRSSAGTIAPLPRLPVSEADKQRLRSLAHYQSTINHLGYED